MISQIEFNNKKSYDDFNLEIDSLEIGYPKPNILRESIPFMNGSYDFSNINGDLTYSDREINIGFSISNLSDLTTIRVNIIYESVVLWLSSGTNKLKIDHNEGYFIGRVEEISPIGVANLTGRIDVKFTCNPIRFSERYEGSDIWDIFNFELDYSQSTSFAITGTKTVTINNPSIHSITPEVICSGDMEITKNDITYLFKAGTTKDWRFKLDKGENILNIKGTGDIELRFRKEVL